MNNQKLCAKHQENGLKCRKSAELFGLRVVSWTSDVRDFSCFEN